VAVGFVAKYEVSPYSAAPPRSTSVTVADQDMLVVYAMSGNAGVSLTPSGGGLTYTPQQTITTASRVSLTMWTAPSASSQTFTLQVTNGTSDGTGFTALRFTGVASIGNSTSSTAAGAGTVALTTTTATSTVVFAAGDFAVTDGASRAYSTATAGTFTEQTYFFQSPAITAYGGYYADAGTAAAKTVGLTAPTGTFSRVALELVAATGAANVLRVPIQLIQVP
jgi:hypothetical protein